MGESRAATVHVYSIFCLHRALYKIHSWNLFAHEKIKSERKSVVKKEKKKKKQAQRRKKAPFCQEEKKLVYESDWYWRSSSLANKEVALKPKFASTSPGTKH